MGGTPEIIAIIGATCSGKSALALKVAEDFNAYIFSLDSLSIYKEIDIASAKPDKSDLASVRHFAIDVFEPNQNVHAGIFLKLLNESVTICKQDNKNLVIVGGSSFYLKSIIQGLSPLPCGKIEDNKEFSWLASATLKEQYDFLEKLDNDYTSKITPHDAYRIQKGIEIFLCSNTSPTNFFAKNPPMAFATPIKLYCLQADRQILCEHIIKRTKNMIMRGILDEAHGLLQKYGEDIQPFKSIGLKECLMVLQNKLHKKDLETLIAIHTRQLAKRQSTFNNTQFKNVHFLNFLLDRDTLVNMILNPKTNTKPINNKT